MPQYLRLGKALVQYPQEAEQALLLGRGTTVRGVPRVVESSLVADADGAMVVATGVCSLLIGVAHGDDLALPEDIVVVAGAAEAPSAMVSLQCLRGVAHVRWGGGAMYDNVFYV